MLCFSPQKANCLTSASADKAEKHPYGPKVGPYFVSSLARPKLPKLPEVRKLGAVDLVTIHLEIAGAILGIFKSDMLTHRGLLSSPKVS